MYVYSGRFGTIVPLKMPLSTVVGEPIKVTKNESPSKEEVEALLKNYEESLKKLFDEYKAKCGYPDAVLEVR